MTLRPAIAVFVAAAFTVGASSCGSDEPGRSSGVSPVSTTVSTTVAPTTTASPTSALPTTASPTTTPPATSTMPAPSAGPVFAFPSSTDADGWQVVNDTVMGGVSNGELSWDAGVLTFAGELSLENNGGFASIRSPAIDAERAVDWAAGPGVRVEADGDGRTWTVELRADGDPGGWISTFTTSPDGVTTVELPWAEFEPVTRFLEPRTASGPLDPARVVTVAFFLVDGVEGPFRLGLRSIG